MEAKTGGLTFTGALQIVFIVLKLLNVIDWSWWIVLLPIEITTVFAVILAAVLIFIKKKLGG